MLNRQQIIPYELELRDTIDACLFRLQNLERAAAECAQLDQEMKENDSVDYETFQAKGRSQSRIFDELDAFLGAYARISLLLFPVTKHPFTVDRGASLRSCLRIDATSPLANRDLRDAWMHHDERLDTAVSRNQHAGGQLFKLSSDVTPANKQGFLRVIEIDTLVVHYHDRSGNTRSADLKQLRAALETLDETRKSAFDGLPFLE